MAQTPTFDRCDFGPGHNGPHVLPNFFLFSKLVRLAHQPLTACRDLTFGYTASYAQLLTDVLQLRNVLRRDLHPTIRRSIDNDDEDVYIILLGRAGYEFTVAFLALVALGVAAVPISPDLPVKEATYFATKSNAVAVMTAESCLQLGSELEKSLSFQKTQPPFRSIRIKPHILQPCLKPETFQVSSDKYMDLNKPGFVLFTSGTTGPPKGAVRRRGALYDVATLFSDQHGIQEGDVVLHTLPVHHATGITVTLLPFLWSGGCIEFRSGAFNPEWIWERMRRADLHFFSGVPTMYMRLMQYYEHNLSSHPQVEQYIHGVRRIKAMLCGTSALPRPLQQKWTTLRDGKGILTRYGGTEFGNALTVTPWLIAAQGVPDGSVGIRSPGADLVLSNGDHGEILIRNPVLFSQYLNDPTTTRNAIDSNGYFKTGDIARKEGEFYFIEGRASIDILKSGGYKLSALDIEREILGLEYVSEVAVMGVQDEEFGQRVAAAVVLRTDVKESLSLGMLREDLRSSLAGYKMPTLLRVVDEIEKNAMGKVVKKALVEKLFPPERHTDVQVWQRKGRGSKL